MPVIVDSDEEVMKAAIATCLKIDYDNPRVIVINNSLEIEEILISEAMVEDAKKMDTLKIESEPVYIEFDKDGKFLTKF